MIDDHIARRATALRRTLHAEASADGTRHAAELDAVEHALAAVAPVPYRRLLVVLVLAVSAASLGVIGFLRSLKPLRVAMHATLTDAHQLIGRLARTVLTLDVAQLPDALNAIAREPAQTIAFIAVLVLLGVWTVLRPVVPSFRVKRRAFCDARVYELEAKVFGHRPREAPLDLVILALPLSLPGYVGAYMVVDAITNRAPRAGEKLLAGAIVAAVTGVRIGYLIRTRRRREGEPAAAGAPVARSRPRRPGVARVRQRGVQWRSRYTRIVPPGRRNRSGAKSTEKSDWK
jgi:hypothetical protein